MELSFTVWVRGQWSASVKKQLTEVFRPFAQDGTVAVQMTQKGNFVRAQVTYRSVLKNCPAGDYAEEVDAALEHGSHVSAAVDLTTLRAS